MSTTLSTKAMKASICEYEQLKFIMLKKQDQESDFGFTLKWNIYKGVHISQIKQDTAASRNNKLHVGDQLLWIEMQNVRYSTATDVQKILQDAGEKVRMVIAQTMQHLPFDSQQGTIPGSGAQLIPSLWTTDEADLFEVEYLQH